MMLSEKNCLCDTFRVRFLAEVILLSSEKEKKLPKPNKQQDPRYFLPKT